MLFSFFRLWILDSALHCIVLHLRDMCFDLGEERRLRDRVYIYPFLVVWDSHSYLYGQGVWIGVYLAGILTEHTEHFLGVLHTCRDLHTRRFEAIESSMKSKRYLDLDTITIQYPL